MDQDPNTLEYDVIYTYNNINYKIIATNETHTRLQNGRYNFKIIYMHIIIFNFLFILFLIFLVNIYNQYFIIYR